VGQLQAVDAAAWVVELRCIRPVESFRAEFEGHLLRECETAEKTQVGVKRPRTAKAVKAGVAEPRLSHIGEGSVIEVRVANAASTKLLHLRLVLIGALVVAEHTERTADPRHTERRSTQVARERIELPTTHDGAERVVPGIPLPAASERQFE